MLSSESQIKNMVNRSRYSESLQNVPQAHAVGVCRGALGELYQGPAIGMRDEIAIISSLISKMNKVYYSEDSTAFTESSGEEEYVINYSQYRKSFQALRVFCQLTATEWPKGSWQFESELPVARGMASSTADIVATLRCYARYSNVPLTHKLITDVLRCVERSDSVFLNQPVMFCSSQSSIIHNFRPFKSIYCLYMHDIEEVKTDDTKQLLNEYYNNNYQEYSYLWYQTMDAFETKDTTKICRSSTQSAYLSQGVFPKKSFNEISSKMRLFDANGLLVAHTGSVIGYLFCNKPSIEVIESVSLLFKSLGGACELAEISQ